MFITEGETVKRVVIAAIALAMLATPVLAGGFGIRGGLSIDPDQVYFGGHYNVNDVADNLRIVPNVELGLGSDLTLWCLNGDVLYDFGNSPWSVGGELGLNIWKFDGWSSTSKLGLSAVGNYRISLNSGDFLILEAKINLTSSPNWKFGVGYNF